MYLSIRDVSDPRDSIIGLVVHPRDDIPVRRLMEAAAPGVLLPEWLNGEAENPQMVALYAAAAKRGWFDSHAPNKHEPFYYTGSVELLANNMVANSMASWMMFFTDWDLQSIHHTLNEGIHRGDLLSPTEDKLEMVWEYLISRFIRKNERRPEISIWRVYYDACQKLGLPPKYEHLDDYVYMTNYLHSEPLYSLLPAVMLHRGMTRPEYLAWSKSGSAKRAEELGIDLTGLCEDYDWDLEKLEQTLTLPSELLTSLYSTS